MRPADLFYFSFGTQDGTGAAVNADSLPVGTLRRNGSNDGSVSVTITNNATGDYTASGTLPFTYNGGDLLELLIVATVKGVAGQSLFTLGMVERTLVDEPRVCWAVTGTTWYVRVGGNDTNDGLSASTAFATIQKALSVAIAGDLVDIGGGVFAIGNSVLNVPDGVSLSGAGSRLTTITSTADMTLLGAIVAPGNSSVVAHLGIAGVGTGVFQIPFGFRQDNGQRETTNWILDDCYLTGDSDAVYFHTGNGSPPPVRGIVRNTVARTKYDTCNLLGGTNGPWDIQLDFVNNNFRAAGPSVVGAGAGTSRAVACSVGKIRLFGGIYEAQGSSATNTAIDVTSFNSNKGQVESYGALLLSAGTNALDINVAGNGAAIVCGTQYSAAKTNGSNITVRPTSAMLQPNQSFDRGIPLPATLAPAQSFNNTGQTTALPATIGGSGDTVVNQDTGGADNLRFVDGNGDGIGNARITAYVASEWSASPLSATRRGQTFTLSDGRWSAVMMLNSGISYTFVFEASGVKTATKTVTV